MSYLLEGTKIVLTKTRINPGESSAFKVGEKRSGTLSEDAEIDKPLRFKEWEGSHVTSRLSSIRKTKNGIHISTQTSSYAVRIVTEKNDEEFNKWLQY